MSKSRSRLLSIAFLPGIFLSPLASAVTLDEEILQRLQALEANQQKLEKELAERDRRITQLESQLESGGQSTGELQTVAVAPTRGDKSSTGSPGATNSESGDEEGNQFGIFQPGGVGYRIANTDKGTVNFGAWTYVRYLNQKLLDKHYTDSFGREFDLDLRNDFQVNKVNLGFNGWFLNPDFRYLLYTWTSNTSQGESAQVVVAGNLRYRINRALDLGFGIDALPGTRSTAGTFPYWNKVDNRTMADEFFRPSYTTGLWASGALGDDVRYKAMIGNNLSQLGVNAARLDGSFGTVSARIDWMPTTGEFGPNMGFGDFAMHEQLATILGLAVTYSDEDRQSQPGTEDINNSQIRLSDGTRLFQLDAFDTGGNVERAHYQMVSADAGMKYQGLSLHGEYYWRWVDDFKVDGDVPRDDLYDHGFQLQATAMFIPQLLEGYIAGSKIFGEYGNPWDTALGLNWYPMRERLLRVNGELLYMQDSAVGYSSIPYLVGGDGVVFNTNLEMKF